MKDLSNNLAESSSQAPPKGTVYTPAEWAEWAVETYGIADSWKNGARILDPGCGDGALSLAVMRKALHSGFVPNTADLRRIKCIERDKKAVKRFKQKADKLGISLPKDSILIADYLLADPRFKADIVFSNPPWTTFADLDDSDKDAYRDLFRSSGLAPNAKSLLLGGSRIDIAALFVFTALRRDTAPKAVCYFFLPASLHRGEGAHEAFRRFDSPEGRRFALSEYRELDGGAPFPGAGTRRSFAVYHADTEQKWPIPWFSAKDNGTWTQMEARPVDRIGSPLMPSPIGAKISVPPRIPVPGGTLPRQGVNACGASGSFIIEHVEDAGPETVEARAKNGFVGILPRRFVYPLLTGENFKHTRTHEGDPGKPRRWIFLPYSESGTALNEEELKDYPGALEWLNRHKQSLLLRKGTLINRRISKGLWWALMGVGAYNFAPWKIAWEAYGCRRFRPLLLSSMEFGPWQGNQAMHALLSFWDEQTAKKTFERITSQEVEEYLIAMGGAGTKGWAQPSRMKRLFAIG